MNVLKISLAMLFLAANIQADRNGELFNTAIAQESLPDNLTGNATATNGCPPDVLECIEVTPPPPNLRPDDGGAGGIGGSGRDTGPDVPWTNVNPDRIEECKADVASLVRRCIGTYSNYSDGLNTICAMFNFGGTPVGLVTSVGCAKTVRDLTQKAHDWCTLQGNMKEARECN